MKQSAGCIRKHLLSWSSVNKLHLLSFISCNLEIKHISLFWIQNQWTILRFDQLMHTFLVSCTIYTLFPGLRLTCCSVGLSAAVLFKLKLVSFQVEKVWEKSSVYYSYGYRYILYTIYLVWERNTFPSSFLVPGLLVVGCTDVWA